MSLIQGLTVPDNVQDAPEPKGSNINFDPRESGIYHAIITQAYTLVSKNGASGLNLTLKLPDENNFQYQETIYFTNRKGEMFYTAKKTNIRHPLPSFSRLDELCQVVTGKKLTQMSEEKKLVKRWNNDVKENVPEEVDVLHELLDQSVDVALLKIRANDQKAGDDGKWVDTNEPIVKNEIQKFLRHSDGLCLTEINSGVTQRAYATKWLERNAGNTKDTFKEIAGASAPAPQTQTSVFANPVSGSDAPTHSQATESLFSTEAPAQPAQAQSAGKTRQFNTNS